MRMQSRLAALSCLPVPLVQRARRLSRPRCQLKISIHIFLGYAVSHSARAPCCASTPASTASPPLGCSPRVVVVVEVPHHLGRPRSRHRSRADGNWHRLCRLQGEWARRSNRGRLLIRRRQTAGVDVLISDRSESQLSKGLHFVDTLLGKEVKKGKLSNGEADQVRSRIRGAKENGLESGEFGDVDLAIEASRKGITSLEKSSSGRTVAKRTVAPPTCRPSVSRSPLSRPSLPASRRTSRRTPSSPATRLRSRCRPWRHRPSASPARTARVKSSGSISVRPNSSASLIAVVVRLGGSPDPSLSLHELLTVNPVPVMKLVELIPALQTDPTVLATAREFAERMGKTVTQSADTPGTPTSFL